MTILISIVHVIVCLFLILVVLAQQGKGQDLASAFGGGGSQTAFGARGTATLLSKITAFAAVTFMVTSLALSYFRPAAGGGDTVVPDTPAPVTEQAPAPAEDGATEAGLDAEAPAESEGEPAKPPSDATTPEGETKPPTPPPPRS